MKTVIEMALETGFDADDKTTLSSLERFAELVRADEREALIEIVDMHGGSVEIVAAIRARSNT